MIIKIIMLYYTYLMISIMISKNLFLIFQKILVNLLISVEIYLRSKDKI